SMVSRVSRESACQSHYFHGAVGADSSPVHVESCSECFLGGLPQSSRARASTTPTRSCGVASCGAAALVNLRNRHVTRRGSGRTWCRRRSYRPHSGGRNEMDPAWTHFPIALWFGVPSPGVGPAR